MTSDTIDFLMSQKDGANYVVMYQMLCLKTINTGGNLARQLGEIIVPFDIDKIQRDCKFFSVDTIRVGLELFKKLNLIYQDKNGILQIAEFDNMVGSETDYAKQKRLQREKQNLLTVDNKVDSAVEIVHTEYRDKSIEYRDIDIKNKDKEIKKKNTIDYQMIIDEYNNRCSNSNLPTCQKLTDKRKTSMRTFLKEYTFDEMLEVFDRANESEFLTSGTWSCNFDWIINKNNAAKILEGNYSNKKQPKTKEERILNRVDEVDNWV